MTHIAYSNSNYPHKNSDVQMCKLTLIDSQTEKDQAYYILVNDKHQAVLVQFEQDKDGYIVFQDPNISLLAILAHLGMPRPRLHVAWALETVEAVAVDAPIYQLPLCEVLAANM